jgi:hypothetical protein
VPVTMRSALRASAHRALCSSRERSSCAVQARQ